ncbi:MAG: ZIP family metal transporter [Gammaproteobacteria bacterium]|nr:ZIP family metal transporter [Gammaproteobacteria bacterium]
MTDLHPVLVGVLASGVAGLGTGLGAVLIYAVRELRPWTEDALLSGAAGIMLAASFYSLLQPGLEYGFAEYGSRVQSVAVVVAGMLAGGLVLYLIHQHAPHEHFHVGREGPDTAKFARLWLFIIAITLHNFPEGMAVGVGAASGDVAAGTALTLGIGIQNVPEGLAVATSLLAAGYGRHTAFWIAFATGLVEPLGGLLGASMAWLAATLLPAVLAFAAGAMLYIISDEIIPETHRAGHQNIATASLMTGVALMLILTVLVG